jgi:hypothetical protein
MLLGANGFTVKKWTGEQSVKDVDLTQKLANEVQTSIVTKKMRSTIRARYHRAAFHLHNDARVRISLDTELALIREDDYGRTRAGDNWKREDIGIDWPFKQLSAGGQTSNSCGSRTSSLDYRVDQLSLGRVVPSLLQVHSWCGNIARGQDPDSSLLAASDGPGHSQA